MTEFDKTGKPDNHGNRDRRQTNMETLMTGHGNETMATKQHIITEQ